MNELLLGAMSIASTAFVLIAWQLGKERLQSAIIVFLILVSTVGGKTVLFFNHETNTGNIFYASTYLATYFLIERFGKRDGLRSIWIGSIGVIFFSVLMLLSVLLQGSGSTRTLDDALTIACTAVARIGMASLIAYIISQTINVHLYHYLKTRYENVHVWLRANLTNICAQTIDSGIFFSLAFWFELPPDTIIDIMFTGLAIKILYIAMASPFLSMNRIEEDDVTGTIFMRLRL
jgi:uncharacterized integral membrane protein (TIGR00697 family)